MRIALVGYGSMGREVERLAPEQGGEIVARFDADAPIDESIGGACDVAIEFTLPGAAVGNIRTLVGLGVPVVTGTTGWLDDLERVAAEVQAQNGRLLYASNFSVGVQSFFRIVRQAAQVFNNLAMYDAAVHEIHHTRKADSPSGTALSIGELLLAGLERKKELLTETAHSRIAPEALHITSQRLGATIGTHTALFDSEADTIELVHRAKNRSGFALGALLAARWLTGQPPGVYRFDDVFDSVIAATE